MFILRKIIDHLERRRRGDVREVTKNVINSFDEKKEYCVER